MRPISCAQMRQIARLRQHGSLSIQERLYIKFPMYSSLRTNETRQQMRLIHSSITVGHKKLNSTSTPSWARPTDTQSTMLSTWTLVTSVLRLLYFALRFVGILVTLWKSLWDRKGDRRRIPFPTVDHDILLTPAVELSRRIRSGEVNPQSRSCL